MLQQNEKNIDTDTRATDLLIRAPKMTREEIESIMEAKSCLCHDSKTSSMWGEPV